MIGAGLCQGWSGWFGAKESPAPTGAAAPDTGGGGATGAGTGRTVSPLGPEKLRILLARAGISLSAKSIDRVIHRLKAGGVLRGLP